MADIILNDIVKIYEAPSLLRRGLINLYNVIQYDIRHDLTLYIL